MKANFLAVAISAALTISIAEYSSAQSIPKFICKKTTTGAIALRARCKSGETKVNNISSLTGASGTNGTNGTDGTDGTDAPSIYGDGSAGAISVTSGSTNLDPSNPQFTNLSVSAGATLVVPSGSVIRLNGTFSNLGTITVSAGLHSNRYEYQSATGLVLPALSAGMAGIGIRPAQSGDIATTLGVARYGGVGGRGRNYFTNGANVITLPGLFGGGAGAACFAGTSFYTGGEGGGTAVFIVKGAVTNGGTINATGGDVSSLAGGGGGGIVILASEVSVTNSGTINVRGGNGGDSSTWGGAGGGGGGGLIRLIAPTVSNTGTTTVSGGAPGAGGATVTQNNPYCGGGGGGPSIGNGGNGGNISSGDLAAAAQTGVDGVTLTTLIDPAILYR